MAHRSTARLTGRLVVACIILGALPPVARAAVGGGRGGPSLISLAVDGGEADGASFTPAISADGRYVAFASAASTLVSGDTNGVEDVFVFDRVERTTERVSLSGSGGEANGDSYDPAISADGRYVAFTSAASNLTAGDANEELDIFVRDREAGRPCWSASAPRARWATAPASLRRSVPTGGWWPSNPTPTPWWPRTSNHTGDVFVRDLVAEATRLISVGGLGLQTESPSFGPAISADGSSVAFESFSARLVPDDTNGALDVFVADVRSGDIDRVSLATGGGQANDRSYSPSISADGRMVAFASFANNVVRRRHQRPARRVPPPARPGDDDPAVGRARRRRGGRPELRPGGVGRRRAGRVLLRGDQPGARRLQPDPRRLPGLDGDRRRQPAEPAGGGEQGAGRRPQPGPGGRCLRDDGGLRLLRHQPGAGRHQRALRRVHDTGPELKSPGKAKHKARR